ncbi:MAG: hypothetical protein KDE19_09075 [Caldilineaceae bacterium]|nr:hypothetical protein [Caldilineaceae bacterium]
MMDESTTCFPQTLMQVLDQFGAFSYTPQAIQGVWIQSGMRYEDNLFKLTVDVPDTALSHDFVAHLKRELLERFAQLEIYVISFPIAVH